VVGVHKYVTSVIYYEVVTYTSRFLQFLRKIYEIQRMVKILC
jgi:hypothetical protein